MMEVIDAHDSEFAKLLKLRFYQLPKYDQRYFQYGCVVIGASSSLSGLLCNNAFRQVMRIKRRGFLLSTIIVTALPMFQTTFLYQAAIPNVILAGKMNCSICSTLRGTCIGVIGGGLGAASLAALMSTIVFLKYDKRPLPPDFFRFCLTLFKPAIMKMKYFFLFQTVLCMAVSARYYAIYEKMLMIPPEREDEWEKE